MTFYAHCLGTQIEEIHRFADMPDGNVPPEFANQIMHANLSYKGTKLMASDSPPEMGFDGKHSGFSVSVNVDNARDADTVFAALAKDAQAVTMPISKTFWAERFGMLVDQFGVAWMVNCDSEPEVL